MTAPAQDSSVTAQASISSPNGYATTQKECTNSLHRLLRSEQLSSWDSKNADIQLSAISCMDAYRALVTQQKPLELSPFQPEAVVSRVNTQQTSSLPTRHDAETLSLRCRKVMMETDSSSELRYRLYLAAGFAVTQIHSAQARRVPVVLIPVSLERLRGRGSPYTIVYAGGNLRLNPQIAESCSSHVDQLIRPFESDSDLRNFLRSIGRKIHTRLQSRISANTGLFTLQEGVLEDLTVEEQFDRQLERSKPGAEFRPLPPVSENFNAKLASRILRYIDERDLDSALQNFSGYQEHDKLGTLDYDLSIDETRVEKVSKCAQWLCEVGLGHWQLQNLKKLPARIERMSENLQNLSFAPAFNRYFFDDNQSIGTVLNLYKARKKICNAPPEMQHHAMSLHADPETRLLLQKAKIQATSIEQEMEVLHDTFHMSAVPSSAALHKLIKTIAKREESSQLTNPSYFRARRQLNEILKTHNGLITDNDLKRLDKMASTLRFSELFDEDKYYKRYFGSLFHGTDTNWQRLDSIVNFVRGLSYDLDSHQLVGRLTERWPSFQRDFESIQELLRPAAVDAHLLRSLIPLFIEETTTIEAALKTARKLQQKVQTWQAYLIKHLREETLTPYIIAKSQGVNAEKASQLVELPQREYDERIYQHIVGIGLSDDSVAATAEWLLNTLKHLEIDIPTVRRYLDSEASLEERRTAKVL